MSRGVDVNARDTNSSAGMKWGSIAGRSDLAQDLLEKGPDIDAHPILIGPL
jgi:hypothetical protein